ncbi:MAG TPA: hypothetical protein VMS89_07575 [Methanoregulaceae archaeon]|nr:hypothetical protein [Methanoregulaceae archaeon]
MQLPRGSFHAIKRGIVLHSLLDEMERSEFSGYCTISYDTVNFTLVLHSGTYILAEYGKTEGDAAWLKIRDLLTKKVDAALTALSDPQLRLCIEFNSKAELLEPVRRPRHHEVKPAHLQVRSGALANQEPRRAKIPEKPVSTREKQVNEVVKSQEITRNKNPGENDEVEMIDRDLGSLDDMNIDEMTKKIRESCMVTVEKLHLDHLIQKTS